MSAVSVDHGRRFSSPEWIHSEERNAPIGGRRWWVVYRYVLVGVFAGSLLEGCARPELPLGSSTGPVASQGSASAAASAPTPREPPAPSQAAAIEASIPPAVPAPSVTSSAASLPLRAAPLEPDVELLREVASGRRSVSEIVDSSRGVVVIATGNGGSDAPLPPSTRKCGEAAAALVKERIAALVEHDRASMADGGGPSVSCKGLGCSKQPRMEYDPFVQLRFAVMSERLTLLSIDSVDMLLRDPKDVQHDVDEHHRTLVRMASGRCPKGG